MFAPETHYVCGSHSTAHEAVYTKHIEDISAQDETVQPRPLDHCLGYGLLSGYPLQSCVAIAR